MKKYIFIFGILAVLLAIIFSRNTEIVSRKETSDIMDLESAVKMFFIHTGRFPTEEEGLKVLYAPPKDIEEKWKGPYLDRRLNDRWNRPCYYMIGSYRKDKFRIYSIGENGIDEKCKGDDYFLK